LNAAKKSILLLWWLVVTSFTTASALTPGATETRVGQKSFVPRESRQAEPLQTAGLHQRNATCGYELAPESLLAAKGTTSLLPARSPWPGNSGFIEGTVERKFLMPGETIDRYGFGGGRFVSPAGTPVGARALRPGTENLPFNTYQVVKPFKVNAGGVQPWFGQPGLGTQYELPVSVNTLLNRGIIKPAP
jgi:hypothetical protein